MSVFWSVVLGIIVAFIIIRNRYGILLILVSIWLWIKKIFGWIFMPIKWILQFIGEKFLGYNQINKEQIEKEKKEKEERDRKEMEKIKKMGKKKYEEMKKKERAEWNKKKGWLSPGMIFVYIFFGALIILNIVIGIMD